MSLIRKDDSSVRVLQGSAPLTGRMIGVGYPSILDINGDIMQVAKWGNSLAVRLPKALVEELGLKAGDEVDIVAATRLRIEIDKNDRRERAVARMKARQWRLPEGYRFDRDAANER